MPFINGRFYANPAYGRALERARAAEAESEAKRLGHDYPSNRESGNELLLYHRSHGQRIGHETLPYNTADEPEVEELSQEQAGAKHAPKQHAHVPNSSRVTEYPHEKKVGGSRSWRNNNPGNIIYGKGPHAFSRRNGAIGQDYGGFAIFPTMQSGEQAQRALWNSYAQQGLTIDQGGRTWTGGDPPDIQQKYVQGLSNAAGSPPNTPLANLTPEQLNKIIEAQTRHEGFSPGIVEKSGRKP